MIDNGNLTMVIELSFHFLIKFHQLPMTCSLKITNAKVNKNEL